MISVYSVVSSIVFYNLSIFILLFLRRKTDFIARYAISTLLLLSVLSMIRLIVPIDIAPIIIRSEKFVPILISLLKYKFSFLPFSLGAVLLAIWLLGSLKHGIKICYAEYRSYKARRIYPKIRSEQLRRVSEKLDKAYNIVISPKVSQPYTVGIFKPVIYLPFIEYSDSELYYILLHEIQHIKSHDNLKRLIFLIVETVFWWNPLAYTATKDFELLTEYSCDYKVTAGMDSKTIFAYLCTIVSIVNRLNPDEDKTKPKLAVMFAQSYDVNQRFEVLLRRNDQKPKQIRYAVWLIMLLIFVMSYFVIIQPYYSAPAVYSEVDIPVTQDSSYIIISDNVYYLVVNNKISVELTEEELNNPLYDEIPIIGE